MSLRPEPPDPRSTGTGWGRPGVALAPAPDGLHFDLAVVGLGGSGLEAVHAGLDRGWSVLGLDAEGVGAGAAGANGGFLLAGLADFHHVAAARWGRDWAAWVHRRTAAFIDRMARLDPDLVLRTGSLRRVADPAEREDAQAHLHALHADGLRAEWVRQPHEGVHLPDDGAFDPVRVLARSARRARARRAVLARARVDRVEPGRLGWARGQAHARRIVVATDGGLAELFEELRPHVRRHRLQMLATEPAPRAAHGGPVYSRYGMDYWQQTRRGRWMIGGGRDLDPTPEREDGVHPEVQAHLEFLASEIIGTRARVTARWSAPVTYGPDGLPVLTQVRPGVWALGAYSGTGNVVGRILGRVAVELAEGRPSYATGRWMERLNRRWR